MKIEPRSLPLAEELIKVTGLQMTYPYDDLVFVEHNPFLLRFNDENERQVFIHFNKDCELEIKKQLLAAVEFKAVDLGVVLVEQGMYTMQQIGDSEKMRLEFLS